MTAASPTSDTAFRVADRVRVPAPWEVFAERTRRFEVHLNGRAIEMVRGPIALEGYGIRLLRSREGRTGVGFQSSTDLSEAGIHATSADAETVARHSVFPAETVELPGGAGPAGRSVEIVDRKLWADPLATVDAYVAELLRGFEGRKDVLASFGSVRATLIETSIANSASLRASYAQTLVDFEVAVKAFGGPEGAPPGEYWVNNTSRRLEPERLPADIENWCTYAKDVRRAIPPPTGELPVVLPPGVLAGIIPSVIGFRFTGAARLRKISPGVGSSVAAETVTIVDDGLFPWAPASSPFDGDGSPRGGHPVVAAGAVSHLLYDAMHAGAFDVPSTSSASRAFGPGGFADWRRFIHPPRVSSSTLAIAPGKGGTEAELVEQAGEGIWVQQLGWAVPDDISGAFGGEIRIGYRIRHGKIAEPVRGGTVGGTVMAPPGRPSLLTSVAAIGSVAELSEAIVSPPLLIRPLVVAGAGVGASPTSKK